MATTDAPPERGAEEQERINRQLLELLNELRVALPGVQVLFAFLLAVPFQSRFDEITSLEGAVYLITEVIFRTATAVVIAVVSAALFFWLWFGQALRRRLRESR